MTDTFSWAPHNPLPCSLCQQFSMTEKLSTIRLPTPQAQNCATFTPPLSLLGRSNTTVPELYEWNAAHNSDHSLFLFDDKGITRTISWKEANQGVHRAARFFTRYVPVHYEAIGVPPVVAILAASGTSSLLSLRTYIDASRQDTITFATSIIGLLRAGFTVFLISPRNSSDAIAHLLSQTGARHLFTSLDASIKGLTAAVLELIQADSVTSPLDVHPMPLFDDLYPYQPDIPFEPFPLNIRSAEAPAIILHSSGLLRLSTLYFP